MGYGSGIALIVIGAILAFAINIDLDGFVDLKTIGYILMGAGVVVFILSLVTALRRKQSTSTTRKVIDPNTGQEVIERTNRSN
ncbi:hypothetical protein C5E07_16970 [Pseudoclavibacter sp. RFBJ3]|uniref:DUF6458 family protein n=1 Tax=unclassified Pseudoclavibacter TaxID=2615177 RepID=UPI000CE79270|nr:MULTISPECIES: DUF6458 family protein [unclassified Pseudoclavibacter]MBF4460811.1 hypothetical protein [Pseudoclavibacter sp. VKM Ac-2867]MBF4550877.1 hypothetical protein [Pseudoclavibacter sp. VKM Ac-2888]PPF33561.1 hypothetical protein C5E05_17125 [Pseudoclavibacter sp. AY1H1]PPF78631.1 hypothetical protein C5B99_00010 [Pseudoclavibacter sp. Z016]PPF80440.1 hypothetical protein C5C12_17585 [Pseudoclavibacter sp. RFBJ5]